MSTSFLVSEFGTLSSPFYLPVDRSCGQDAQFLAPATKEMRTVGAGYFVVFEIAKGVQATL